MRATNVVHLIKCFDALYFGEFTDASVFYWFLLFLVINTANATIEERAMIVVAISA